MAIAKNLKKVNKDLIGILGSSESWLAKNLKNILSFYKLIRIYQIVQSYFQVKICLNRCVKVKYTIFSLVKV